MEQGDKIICIYSDIINPLVESKSHLTIGNEYTVIFDSGDIVWVVNDAEAEFGYRKTRFISTELFLAIAKRHTQK